MPREHRRQPRGAAYGAKRVQRPLQPRAERFRRRDGGSMFVPDLRPVGEPEGSGPGGCISGSRTGDDLEIGVEPEVGCYRPSFRGIDPVAHFDRAHLVAIRDVFAPRERQHPIGAELKAERVHCRRKQPADRACEARVVGHGVDQLADRSGRNDGTVIADEAVTPRDDRRRIRRRRSARTRRQPDIDLGHVRRKDDCKYACGYHAARFAASRTIPRK